MMASAKRWIVFGSVSVMIAAAAYSTAGQAFEPRFSFDGKRLLASSALPSLWDMETGLEIQVFRGHIDPVWAVAFSPDGKRVLTGGGRIGDLPPRDTSVRLWDAD